MTRKISIKVVQDSGCEGCAFVKAREHGHYVHEWICPGNRIMQITLGVNCTEGYKFILKVKEKRHENAAS